MILDQLRARLAEITYRLRPLDFTTGARRWAWQPRTSALDALDTLTPDQQAAFNYALLQRLRQRRRPK